MAGTFLASKRSPTAGLRTGFSTASIRRPLYCAAPQAGFRVPV